jgi:SAM-dependent methyltransferase
MRRKFDPTELELMDRPQPVTGELERDLKNLRSLNRWFGSYALIRHFLRRWIKPGDRLRIADLATGSGDIPRMVVNFGRVIGADLEVAAVDQQSSTLEIASKLSAGYPEISFIQADILNWRPAESFDLVLNSLALHHFSEADAVKVLLSCRELSRRFVLVSDLRRSWLATGGVHLLTMLIFREPMTRFDARLSAERAFSLSEMRELARRAGWKNFGQSKYPFARQAIWLQKA